MEFGEGSEYANLTPTVNIEVIFSIPSARGKNKNRAIATRREQDKKKTRLKLQDVVKSIWGDRQKIFEFYQD